MSEIAWLTIALLAVWAGIGLYLLSLGRRQKAIERLLEEIREEQPKRD